MPERKIPTQFLKAVGVLGASSLACGVLNASTQVETPEPVQGLESYPDLALSDGLAIRISPSERKLLMTAIENFSWGRACDQFLAQGVSRDVCMNAYQMDLNFLSQDSVTGELMTHIVGGEGAARFSLDESGGVRYFNGMDPEVFAQGVDSAFAIQVEGRVPSITAQATSAEAKVVEPSVAAEAPNQNFCQTPNLVCDESNVNKGEGALRIQALSPVNIDDVCGAVESIVPITQPKLDIDGCRTFFGPLASGGEMWIPVRGGFAEFPGQGGQHVYLPVGDVVGVAVPGRPDSLTEVSVSETLKKAWLPELKRVATIALEGLIAFWAIRGFFRWLNKEDTAYSMASSRADDLIAQYSEGERNKSLSRKVRIPKPYVPTRVDRAAGIEDSLDPITRARMDREFSDKRRRFPDFPLISQFLMALGAVREWLKDIIADEYLSSGRSNTFIGDEKRKIEAIDKELGPIEDEVYDNWQLNN